MDAKDIVCVMSTGSRRATFDCWTLNCYHVRRWKVSDRPVACFAHSGVHTGGLSACLSHKQSSDVSTKCWRWASFPDNSCVPLICITSINAVKSIALTPEDDQEQTNHCVASYIFLSHSYILQTVAWEGCEKRSIPFYPGAACTR